jgi:hypothetical protein
MAENCVVLCQHCGASFSDDTTCADRFSELLLAEGHDQGLAQMHALTVLTYHVQHPQLTRPWYQIEAREALRRVFEDGEPVDAVFVRRRGAESRAYGAALARRKHAAGNAMPSWVTDRPVLGEMTVRDLDPAIHGGWQERIMSWARSVAALRFGHARSGSGS